MKRSIALGASALVVVATLAIGFAPASTGGSCGPGKLEGFAYVRPSQLMGDDFQRAARSYNCTRSGVHVKHLAEGQFDVWFRGLDEAPNGECPDCPFAPMVAVVTPLGGGNLRANYFTMKTRTSDDTVVRVVQVNIQDQDGNLHDSDFSIALLRH